MGRQVTSYFHRRTARDDLSALRREHHKQFPGNELAILKGLNDTLLVKVAYPPGTAKPRGCLTMDEAKKENELATAADRLLMTA